MSSFADILSHLRRQQEIDRELIELEPDIDERDIPDGTQSRSVQADIAAGKAIAQALRTAGVGAQDLATVHVTGRLATGVRWSGPGTELRATVLHLWADAKGLRASHDLDRYRTSTGMTTEERFARELIARLDATQDPRERERLEYALTLGLDAFHSGAIAPMWTGGES